MDDELEDIIDKYVRKETKRILKEREKDEMEMDIDPEDHPQNSGEMFKDVLDITNEFEHSGPSDISLGAGSLVPWVRTLL